METFFGKTEAMNTNNIQNSPQGLAHPFSKTDTTNAHAPVGYEQVAFEFENIFLCANFVRLENFWLFFPKMYFTDAKILLFPQTPKYFSILFSIGNDLYIINIV